MSHICISPKCERCAQEIATLRKEKASLGAVCKKVETWAVSNSSMPSPLLEEFRDVLAKVSGEK